MISVGILGAGVIAATMAKTINMMKEPDIRLYAVASRDQDRANAFARTWGIPKAFGSYEEMLADPELTLVYVATPHSHHRDHALLCAEYGKHVLCEKAFCANERQAAEVLEAFKNKGLLAAEAIWTRYQPMRQMLWDVVHSGIVGEPRMLRASLNYPMETKERILRPDLAGGALLDVGVYPLNLADMLFGPAESWHAFGALSPTGVDMSDSMTLEWADGKLACLSASAACLSDEDAFIDCSDGYIQVRNVNNPQWYKVFSREKGLLVEQYCPAQLTGYEYEVLECAETIRQGKTECPSMPHRDILRMMRQMDDMRAQMGVVYPFD